MCWLALFIMALILGAIPAFGQELSADDTVTATPSVPADPDSIPEPAALVGQGDDDIVNFLLLGSDTSNPANVGRTDVILVVSVNRTAQTVAMLSIPRDLYVYIPGDRVYRINTAYSTGEHSESADGPGLLMETLRYNLGLVIDYYARVDFSDFRQIIDDVGGVEIAVDCGIEDWRLISPELDPQDSASWEMFTLPIGVHQMDGDLALWYMRSRRTSSDLDRGRRQQVLMRALLTRLRELGLLEQITDVWPQVLEAVDTNVPLNVLLGLVPFALNLEPARISAYVFSVGREVQPWRSPEDSAVLAPDREVIAALLQQMMTPPTTSRLGGQAPSIEIVNASGVRTMGQIAAARLEWEGFRVYLLENEPYVAHSRLLDLVGASKESAIPALQASLNLDDDQIETEPSSERSADYRFTIGADYYPCTYPVVPPSSG